MSRYEAYEIGAKSRHGECETGVKLQLGVYEIGVKPRHGEYETGVKSLCGAMIQPGTGLTHWLLVSTEVTRVRWIGVRFNGIRSQ